MTEIYDRIICTNCEFLFFREVSDVRTAWEAQLFSPIIDGDGVVCTYCLIEIEDKFGIPAKEGM